MKEVSPGLQHRAEALAAPLPPLLVKAEQVAATVAQGIHGRRRTGPGDSFWQFRRYQAGDPATAIDWRQSAKSDPLYVRETEWAAAQSVWFWVDPSPSMRWRSQVGLVEKIDRANLLALALASLLLRGGERVGLIGDAVPPTSGRAALARLAATLISAAGDGRLPTQPLSRHSHLVLFSDFLMPLAELAAAVRRWAQADIRGHLVQVLDPAEESLPYDGRLRVCGLEGEGELLLPRTEAVRDAYVERLVEHRAGLAATARAFGWTFSLHHTDRAPNATLLALHSALDGH